MRTSLSVQITALLCGVAFCGFAQNASIEGYLLNESGEALPFATIALQGTTYGTTTSENGYFQLEQVPAGTYIVAFSMIGYRKTEKNITLQADEKLQLGETRLAEDVLGLEEVVVTGAMKETWVSASPVKVETITARYLEKNVAPTNIMEAITLVNGVQEAVACGVCFTNSISINGLPGPYTAVLMDGAPIYGNLASVYGLNGIPTTIIERFEVVKGPVSTLYGSEAVAGVINIITKDPSKQPLLAMDIMGTSHGESFGSISVSPKAGKFNGYVGLNYAYINAYEDNNEDGFGDFINLDRFSVFTKWSQQRKDKKQFTIAGKWYYEDRRNGVEAFLKDRAYRQLRGSDSVYGESIYTNRFELFGTYELPVAANLRIDYSFSHHDQDSYYGADAYRAQQQTAFANTIWRKAKGKHDYLTGLTLRYQFYDDNTFATQSATGADAPERQFIPGVFVQDEWQASKQLTLLAGARLDHYTAHGFIFAPRLNVKYKPGDWTTLRANMGSGFRVVNLFAEDHAFITGQRAVEVAEALRPERSWNAALNFNHIYLLGDGQGTLDVDLFYTWFANKIIPDYNTPGKIIYANSAGHAASRGISANVSHRFRFPLALNLGVSAQRVTQTEPNNEGKLETTPIPFAPEWSGIATLNYTWQKPALTFAYTLRLTGPMALPEVFDLDDSGQPLPYSRPTRSDAFAFQNIQLTKAFSKARLEVYLGLQNVFNYRQAYSPLSGYNDPLAAPGFSNYFDTAYAYAAATEREVYFGVRWNVGKRK